MLSYFINHTLLITVDYLYYFIIGGNFIDFFFGTTDIQSTDTTRGAFPEI